MQSFYFVRHGETDWNKKQIPMGQTDIPLNERGIQQSLHAQNLLSDISFRTIISSPLQRAQLTASIIAEKQRCPIIISDDLKEASWGVFEGKKQQNEDWLEEWCSGLEIENGESFTKVQLRAKQALFSIFNLPDPCLIVSHGALYLAIQKLLNFDFIDVANCEPVYHQAPALNQENWQRLFKK